MTDADKALSLLVSNRSPAEVAKAKANVQATLELTIQRLIVRSMSTAGAARMLRCSETSICTAVHERALLGFSDLSKALWLPAMQFRASMPLPGLPEVLQALDRPGRLGCALWLTSPSLVFEGRSPLETLGAGELERVVREARGVQAAAG